MRMNLTLKRFIKFALYLIWISTVVVIGLVYIRQGNIDNFKVASNNVDSDAPSFTGVEIYLTIPNVDLKKYDYNIHFEWKYKLNGTLVEKPGRNLTIDCKN